MYLVIKPYSQECGTLWCLWTIWMLRIMNGWYYLGNRLANFRKGNKTYQCARVPSFNLTKSYYIHKHANLSTVSCIILYYIILYYIILYYIILYYIILYYIILYYIILYYIILYYIQHQSYCTQGKCTYVTYNAINTKYGRGICVLGAVKLFFQFERRKNI